AGEGAVSPLDGYRVEGGLRNYGLRQQRLGTGQGQLGVASRRELVPLADLAVQPQRHRAGFGGGFECKQFHRSSSCPPGMKCQVRTMLRMSGSSSVRGSGGYGSARRAIRSAAESSSGTPLECTMVADSMLPSRRTPTLMTTMPSILRARASLG